MSGLYSVKVDVDALDDAVQEALENQNPDYWLIDDGERGRLFASAASRVLESFGIELGSQALDELSDGYAASCVASDCRPTTPELAASLLAVALSPGEDAFAGIVSCRHLREFPPTRPGTMYSLECGPVPAADATLAGRLSAIRCGFCRTGWYCDEFFAIREDDGTISCGPPACECLVSPDAVGDDVRAVDIYGEDGTMNSTKGCSMFEWN